MCRSFCEVVNVISAEELFRHAAEVQHVARQIYFLLTDILIPQRGMLSDELGHQRDARGVLQHFDRDAA